MSTPRTVPARITNAVERLRLKGDESVLEIGCGRGVAAALICERLTTGRLVAIDRSPAAITAAAQRCCDHVATRRLELAQAWLEEFEPTPGRFDRALAVNVNLFWLKTARGLAVVKAALKPAGTLLLAYEPPTEVGRDRIIPLLTARLAEGGFSIDEIVKNDAAGVPLLIVRARPA